MSPGLRRRRLKERERRETREREARRPVDESTPTPAQSPSPSPLPSPTPSPSPFPVEAWLQELDLMNETGSLPESGCTHHPSPLPSESGWPIELEFNENYIIPAPSPSPLPLEVSGPPGRDLEEVDTTPTPSPSPLPSDSDAPVLLEFADEIRHYHMRQGEPDPWRVTPSPRPPVGSEGPGESDRAAERESDKREQGYSDYSRSKGPLVNGSFIDCGSLSHPQWSDLNDWNPHQNEIQLSEVTDLEVVGVEGFELLRPVGLEENQPHLDVENGIRQEALRDQEDYLRGVQGGVDCQEEEQLPHLEEVHVAEARGMGTA